MTLREKHQQGQFTITVELDPPKSSSAEKTFEQAARLKGKVDAINIAKTLNAGKDLAGNDLDAPTNFYIGATGNPGAPDLEIERQKLAAKIQNGAHFVQTQPIYDLEQAKRYIDKMSEFDVPIMLGLIPLKSFKMATYLHEKVPGINLTQEILDRMEKGGKEAGTEIAIETLEQIKKIAAGVHIMPLNDIDTTLHIIDHV